MAQRHPPPPADEPDDPNAEARKLAEKMASVLHDKPTRDAAVAVAILMAGVVASHAKDAEDASELLDRIQKLCERFVSSWMDDEKPDLLN
jgi:hypothetical protein